MFETTSFLATLLSGSKTEHLWPNTFAVTYISESFQVIQLCRKTFFFAKEKQ